MSAPAPPPPARLSEAVAGSDWTLRTPTFARRHVGDLAAYVLTVLGDDGTIAHYAWWVETAGLAVAATDTAPSPGGAIGAADGALALALTAKAANR